VGKMDGKAENRKQLFSNTVNSRFFVEGIGEKKCAKTKNPKNNFLKRRRRALSFASWQNFASIEKMTFLDLKCVHGPRQLHCVH
jgi:hypothetical protein